MTTFYLKLALWLFERWAVKQKNSEEMLKLFNNFLKQIGTQTEAVNKASLAIEAKLKAKREEIRKRGDSEQTN